MSRAKEHMPVLLMGGLLIVYGFLIQGGALLPMMKYLHVHKSMDLQVMLSFIVGE